jgi:hypothetical protein
MGLVASYRISPQVSAIKVSNIPHSRHVLPSECKSMILVNADLISYKYIQWMFQNFCEFSSDYPALLRSLGDPVTLSRLGKIIQFPFSQPVIDEKTEEEQARLVERRREQGKRLQEMAARARTEKVSASTLTVDYIQDDYFSWKPKRRTCVRC